MSGAPSASPPGPSMDRVATLPNLISLMRILLIPVFVILLARRRTEVLGLGLLVAVVATDWIDGQVARRTGQVSNVGKLLDPLADRLALGAALVTLVVRGAFPLWAALIVLVRDGLLVLAGAALLFRTRVRIDVRNSGKVATGCLMFGVPLIAWGNFERPLAQWTLWLGWTSFAVGLLIYLATTVGYVLDARKALAMRRV